MQGDDKENPHVASFRSDVLQAPPHIGCKVVGIGGAGSNIAEYIHVESAEKIGCLLICGELYDREISSLPTIVLSKEQTTWHERFSADNRRQEAIQCTDEIREALEGADVVFVVAGMGGGIGSGAAPIVAQIAKGIGAVTIGLVTMPFAFEGKKRMETATLGLQALRDSAHAVLVYSNDAHTQTDKSLTMVQAFDRTKAAILTDILTLSACGKRLFQYTTKEIENIVSPKFTPQQSLQSSNPANIDDVDKQMDNETKTKPEQTISNPFKSLVTSLICKMRWHIFQSGLCTRCGAKHTIACPECKGKGTITREHQEDNPYISMSGCGGENVTYQTAKCEICGGTGKIFK